MLWASLTSILAMIVPSSRVHNTSSCSLLAGRGKRCCDGPISPVPTYRCSSYCAILCCSSFHDNTIGLQQTIIWVCFDFWRQCLVTLGFMCDYNLRTISGSVPCDVFRQLGLQLFICLCQWTQPSTFGLPKLCYYMVSYMCTTDVIWYIPWITLDRTLRTSYCGTVNSYPYHGVTNDADWWDFHITCRKSPSPLGGHYLWTQPMEFLQYSIFYGPLCLRCWTFIPVNLSLEEGTSASSLQAAKPREYDHIQHKCGK